MRIVEYFGYEVAVPDNATHLAADDDGNVYAFVGEPNLGACIWWPKFGFGGPNRLHQTDCPKLDTRSVNWRDSLKEIKP